MNRGYVYFGDIKKQDEFFSSVCSDAKRAYSFFLAGLSPYGEVWAVNNHINLQVAADALSREESPEINIRTVFPFFDATRFVDAVKISPYTEVFTDISAASDFLRTQLTEKKAVLCPLDMYYLPHNDMSGDKHASHQTLLYGINTADDSVCVRALSNKETNRTLSGFEIPLETVAQAILSECCLEEADIEIYSLREDVKYELDPAQIVEELRYFLSGADICRSLSSFFDNADEEVLDRGQRKIYESENYVFGIDCYKWLADYLRTAEGSCYPLFTSLQSIKEHVDCELFRILFLRKRSVISGNSADTLLKKCRNVVRTAGIVQMMNIKYTLSKNLDILKRIADKLDSIAAEEKEIAQELIDCLTEKNTAPAYSGYCCSKYNLFQQVEDRCVAINTLCGSFVSVEKESDAYFWLKNGIEDVKKNKTVDHLIEQGFFVPKGTDEFLLASHQWITGSSLNSMLRLIILPTENCNFRCLYCYENHVKSKMSDGTLCDIVDFVKRNIHNYAALRISWFGGEPLMCMDIIERLSNEFLKICRMERRMYIADITTNGYLLTPDIMRKLLRLRVLSYQVTVDGPGWIHDRNRPLAGGGGTYSEITSNIKRIREEIKTGTFNFVVRVNYTQESLECISDFTEELKKLCDGDGRFSILFRPAGDWGGNIDEGIRCSLIPESSDRFFPEIIGRASGLNLSEHIKFLLPCGYLCYASCPSSFVIDPHGNIRKCTCHLESKENLIGKLENGKMKIDRYALAKWDISNGEVSQKCIECVMFPICGMSTCPARHIVLKKTEEGVDCPLESKGLPQIITALEKMKYFERIECFS